MNGTNVLLDTNIVLYLLSGSDELEHLLQGTNIFLSVTKVELLSHPALDEAGEQVIHELLAQTTIMEFAPDSSSVPWTFASATSSNYPMPSSRPRPRS